MLSITIPPSTQPSQDYWDEATEQFVVVPGKSFDGEELLLEHSLVSVSKWEEITLRPFLDRAEKTREDARLYIKCMLIAPINHPDALDWMTDVNIKAIDDYMGKKATATKITEVAGSRGMNNGEFVTAELIYYWMSTLQIDFQAQYWHLDKLITLVRTINAKQQAPKKGRPFTKSMLEERRALAAARRAEMGTTG